MTKLGAPFETPGSWDDWTTYAFSGAPEYGDASYPTTYTNLWGDGWKHMDNLDHVRPGNGPWMEPSAWLLSGREFPGPAAE